MFSNASGDFIAAHATSMTSLSLSSSHMDITEACVSSGSTVPSQASSGLLLPLLISLRSEQDHFNSVQWPKEQHRQRGALCIRHPCDGIIRATRSSRVGVSWITAGCPQHCQWQQKQKASFFSKQVKSQVYEIQAEHFRSVPFKAKKGVNAENSSSADYLALFFLKCLQPGCVCSVFPQHESVLNKFKFHQEFLHCVCQRID